MFSVFRALTRFSDLPLKDKVVRILFWPYFALASLFSAPTDVPTSPHSTLYELPPREAMDPVTQQKSAFDFGSLRGRPVLVVNVASACGLTAQNYAELSSLYEPLKAKTGLEVLAFPCDQFMHQEKGACVGGGRAWQRRACPSHRPLIYGLPVCQATWRACAPLRPGRGPSGPCSTRCVSTADVTPSHW